MRGINPTKFNLCLCVKVGHARSPLIIQELYSWEVISEDARSAYVTDKKERDYKFHFILLIIEYNFCPKNHSPPIFLNKISFNLDDVTRNLDYLVVLT